jgi:MoaA/NifB/PqqE/SkfB family radical SAM enzyme
MSTQTIDRISATEVQAPTPTKRAGIDTGWKCNVECKFCYHIFKDTNRAPEPIEKVKASILAAKARGNDTIDLVGPGEPSIVPHIGEVIRFAKDNGLRVCMITHGIIGAVRLSEIFDAGLDDFLISMHGMDATHNSMVGEIKGARKAQEKTIQAIKDRGMTYRVNYVINSHNLKDIPEFSEYLVGLPLRPRIINFINFNPHGEWSGNMASKDFVADLRAAEPMLDAAIDLLEANGIGVNLRYYPMCRISESHRKNVCNDLQVMLDPYEWDYSVLPKTTEHYINYGQYISRTIEEKNGVCGRCDIRGICGGINRQFNLMTDGRLIDSIKSPQLAGTDDFYHYRQHNTVVFDW